MQKYCSIACRDEAASIISIQPCKVCKKPFKKRRKGTVCCSVECFNANKKGTIDRDVLIEAMLQCRYGAWPDWTNISKKLKCCHRFAVKMAKHYGLIDDKRRGPIVDGVHLPIPEKQPEPINPELTSKETLEKLLIENREFNYNDCWMWTKRVDFRGYGIMYLPRPYDDEYLIKNISLYIWKGIPLEKKKFVFHKCNVRQCFKPDHLIPCETRLELAKLFTEYGRNKLPLGKKHVRWTLDLPTAMDIRDAIILGETNKQIVKRFGIKSQIVQNIRMRRTWKYIWKLKHEYIRDVQHEEFWDTLLKLPKPKRR
jgi:hypothetical protein